VEAEGMLLSIRSCVKDHKLFSSFNCL